MRLNLRKTDPAFYQNVAAIDKEIALSAIDRWHWEMIKIKASQINGCAYCVDKHTQDALALGINPRKVNLLSAWKEAKSHFSEEEQILLQLTEEITLIHQKGLTEETFQKCVGKFGEDITGKLIIAATTINVWTRIGIALKMEPSF